jgi:RNA recognition motif-containing protein
LHSGRCRTIQPVPPFSGDEMETKLYVGNMPYSMSEADLTTMFTQAGAVRSASIIQDRETGRSKGFGFVEMTTQEEAQKAISLFNGKDLQGRSLVVNIARPREDRGGPGGGGGGGGRRGGPGGGGHRGGPGGGGGGGRRDW